MIQSVKPILVATATPISEAFTTPTGGVEENHLSISPARTSLSRQFTSGFFGSIGLRDGVSTGACVASIVVLVESVRTCHCAHHTRTGSRLLFCSTRPLTFVPAREPVPVATATPIGEFLALVGGLVI